MFAPKAVYGYFPGGRRWQCGRAVRSRGPPRGRSRASTLPRQDKANGLCIADFLRDISEPERDVIGLQVVTVGQRASDVAREWFAADRYNDYVRLHGLGVELAEALAEYVHKRFRSELGFGHLDARDRAELIKQGYRGSRYSFGYPACPNLADQRQLLALLDAVPDRRRARRRGPALARAVDLRDRPAPPPGALFQRLSRQRRRAVPRGLSDCGCVSAATDMSSRSG